VIRPCSHARRGGRTDLAELCALGSMTRLILIPARGGYEIPAEEAFDTDEEMDFVGLKACYRTGATISPGLEDA
jgi:hypothetical protein